MPPLRSSAPPVVLALVAVAATALAVGARAVDREEAAPAAEARSWAGLVGGEPADVDVGQRVIVVLRAPSLADRVREAGGRASDREHRRWTRGAASAQRLFVSQMAVQGARVLPELRFTRLLNGFSATLEPRSLALLERSEDVLGVYPVRAAFPASVSSPLVTAQSALAAPVRLPGFDGRGVTVAVLDTGVERTQPALARRLGRGFDVVGGGRNAAAAARPGTAAELERHGTQAAGIVAGAPELGIPGVAPGASLLPIRVAGWQQDASGGWAIYARTDQLIAGLERAVDPNADGSAHDAARIALVGVAERFASFGEGPLARAAAGALALDMLVVAPAGNDGPKGPGFGSISGPGGAPDALTVTAADVRQTEQRARLVIRAGLNLLVDRAAPLGGLVAPARPLSLRLAEPRLVAEGAGPEEQAAALELGDFFDEDGYSLVAGRAAVVPGGREPRRVAAAAARAGAAAVLLYGSRLPAGALGVGDGLTVPVVTISAGELRRTLAALEQGASVGVSIGSVEAAANRSALRAASFASRGLALDGRVKPELAAPGIAVPTTEPGVNENGAPRLVTVNGSSAAAAVVAGAAALVVQARPNLRAATLKSILVGSARPLDGVPVVAQGAGLVDPSAAASAELVAAPVALAFGRATHRGWERTQTVTVRNVSTRTLRLRVAMERRDFPAAETRFAANPAQFRLRPGGSTEVRVTATVSGQAEGGPPAEGVLVVRPRAGVPLRIPFAVAFGPAEPELLGGIQLSEREFEASEAKPAVLSVRAGSVRTVGGVDEIEALARLDVELWTSEGERLGVIARIRNVLPGRYTFGVTGRGPEGQELLPGVYRLRLVGYRTGPGRPVVKTLQFTLK